MLTVKLTDEFSHWLADIKDGETKRRLIKRLRKATQPSNTTKAIKLAATLED